MLDLTQLGDWRPPIVDTVASSGDGVDDLWQAIVDHREHLLATGSLDAFRRQRLAREFHQILLARVEHQLDELLAADRFAGVVADMSEGVLDPYEAADRLLDGLLPGA